jgi:beta-lactamase regulating signal transducer with metallopeptidase domain
MEDDRGVSSIAVDVVFTAVVQGPVKSRASLFLRYHLWVFLIIASLAEHSQPSCAISTWSSIYVVAIEK